MSNNNTSMIESKINQIVTEQSRGTQVLCKQCNTTWISSFTPSGKCMHCEAQRILSDPRYMRPCNSIRAMPTCQVCKKRTNLKQLYVLDGLSVCKSCVNAMIENVDLRKDNQKVQTGR